MRDAAAVVGEPDYHRSASLITWPMLRVFGVGRYVAHEVCRGLLLHDYLFISGSNVVPPPRTSGVYINKGPLKKIIIIQVKRVKSLLVAVTGMRKAYPADQRRIVLICFRVNNSRRGTAQSSAYLQPRELKKNKQGGSHLE